MLNIIHTRWMYKVRGYAGSKHPRARLGDLLLETVHGCKSSMEIEVLCWKDRIKRGDASRCEVIDLETHKTETIYE